MTPQQGFTPHVATLGQGPRQALALHCTMAFSGAWAGLVKQMADQIRLIAPDMPSHGQSADWDEVSNFADTVFSAAAGCLSERMDVIGHSFGAATALRLAIALPDKVRSLTLIEPVFFCIAKMDAPDIVATHGAKLDAFFAAFDGGDRESAARHFNRMWSDGPRWDDMPQSLRRAMTRGVHVVPDTTGFLYDDDCGLVPQLGDLAVPSLLIRGERTDPIVAATNTGLARRLPDAQDETVAGAGHMVPISHPREVAALWSEFLART